MANVYVLDDDKGLDELYLKKLTSEGFDTRVFSAGDELLHQMNATHKLPDIIVLDLVMPGLDGFDVLKLLRDHDTWKNIPVLIVSNLENESYKKIGTDLGAIEFLIKSDTSLETIVETIRTLLARVKKGK